METIKKNKFPLVAIVAVSRDFIIGDGNKMLWHLPNDLKRLKYDCDLNGDFLKLYKRFCPGPITFI